MTSESSTHAAAVSWTPERLSAWRCASVVASALLVLLAWLLARLIWLPFLFGLFFFLVAGLLVGSVAFRFARAARPVPGAVVVRTAVWIAIVTLTASTCFEYLHFAQTFSDPPRFAEARNAVQAEGSSLAELHQRLSDTFRAALKAQYPPGGVLGYIRWTVAAVDLPIEIEGHVEQIRSEHAGLLWLIRTLMATVLVAAGLWSSLESLRSATPVRNILLPGEPYEEDE